MANCRLGYKYNNVLAMDLELNHDSEGRTAEIIQVGYVIGNFHTGEVLEQVRRYVKNQHTRPITPFITELTGITDDDINQHGITLHKILDEMDVLIAKHDVFVNPVTWGGGDSAEMRAAVIAEDQAQFRQRKWPFGRRWIDTKTLYVAQCLARGENFQGGLKKVCNRLGIQFDGPAHDALQDALNTFKVFCYFARKERADE
jgi:inhibitor of KinA sporulation pathway (predicted exonuclease)